MFGSKVQALSRGSRVQKDQKFKSSMVQKVQWFFRLAVARRSGKAERKKFDVSSFMFQVSFLTPYAPL